MDDWLGHTGLQHKDGTVRAGRKITEEEATELLRYDMRQLEARVSSLIDVPLSDDQFSALVSFDFNTGALHSSTLGRLLTARDYWGATMQFERWNKAGGRVLAGLTRRREVDRATDDEARVSERNLFCGFPNPIVGG